VIPLELEQETNEDREAGFAYYRSVMYETLTFAQQESCKQTIKSNGALGEARKSSMNYS
jgi:hypothetical protein